MERKEIRETHPSFGTISFSRIVGNPGRLFGSSFSGHESFVSLRIGAGERIRNNGHERYHGHGRNSYIEVYLSAGQFAEFITTLNTGSGIPCTIHTRDGELVPPPPEEPAEVEKIRSDFEQDAKNLAKQMTSMRESVRQLMDKKTLGQQDRKDILRALDQLIMEVKSNMPFMLEQFVESTEKVVQHAKAEIDSFMAAAAMAVGCETLASGKDVLGLLGRNSEEYHLLDEDNKKTPEK